LGDLHDGRTTAYPNSGLPYEWSPDSVHFFYTASQLDESGLYLATVNYPSVFIGNGEFLGWLDASKYLYYNLTDKTFFLGEIGKEPMPILIGITPLQIHDYPESFIFTYQDR